MKVILNVGLGCDKWDKSRLMELPGKNIPRKHWE